MFKHDFFSGPRKSYDEVVEFIAHTDKPLKYTYGLGYRHPTTYRKPVSADEALRIVKEHWGMIDIDEYEDYVHLNAYSANDMW